MPETFSATVTVNGSVAAGNYALTMQQVPDAPIRPEQPPTEPPVEPPPSGSFTPPSWLRSDTERVSVPNVAKPAYLQPFADPVFHTPIIRISGDPGSPIPGISGGTWGNETRHHYSSDCAWSADESQLFLDTNKGGSPSSLILDGQTYQPLYAPQNKPSSADVRWDPANPEWMLCAAKDKLLRWNPRSGEQVVVESFPEFDDLLLGPWEGSPSNDGKRVVLTSESQASAFVYDLEAGRKYPTIQGSNYGQLSDCRISRGGLYMIWKVSPDEVFVTDFEGHQITHLPNNFISHFDCCVDANGDECIAGRVNSSSVNQGPSGYVSKFRLADGKRTGLQKAKGWSSHTSCRSNTFYCVTAPTLESGSDYVYVGELILLALDGSNTWRLAHTHTVADPEYVQECQPSHSPQGGRVIFASPWGSSSGVGAFVADFRS
jgi:hypothetical protein